MDTDWLIICRKLPTWLGGSEKYYKQLHTLNEKYFYHYSNIKQLDYTYKLIII